MKKIKLKALSLGATEVLTREQLKNVLGGDGSSTGNRSAYICGTRLNYGQCYCDFCDVDTYFPMWCDVPCNISPCV